MIMSEIELENQPIRLNDLKPDPTKNTVSVGYNWKGQIILSVLNEHGESITTITMDYNNARIVNALMGVALENIEYKNGITRELVE